MKKGLLVGSGMAINKEKLLEESKTSNIIIAVDGGINHLFNNEIKPDLILGDLDSVTNKNLKIAKEKDIDFLKFPKEKNFTDMELGIKYLKENNYDEIVIIGATGTRLDHTLANMYLLSTIDYYGMTGRIEDDNNTIILVKDFLKLKRKKGYFISVIPISDKGITVTLKGFKYPLDDYKIGFASTIGISNEITERFAEIHIKKGKALVFISKD